MIDHLVDLRQSTRGRLHPERHSRCKVLWCGVVGAVLILSQEV